MTTAGFVGWATLLLLAGVVCPVCGAPQHTTNLGLQLGGAAYENQNWQILDQAVCAPGCITGSVGNLIPAATAPFPCAATTGGLYLDTDCAQVCRCNPGQARWCRSDTGACLSATDCCAPPTTTTTTLGTAAPNWCAAMLACWMLDEVSGTRVNAQGTVSRNLTESGGTVVSNTVQKQEGLASADFVNTNVLSTTDPTLIQLPAPLTCGFWGRPTGTINQDAMRNQRDQSGGFELYIGPDHIWRMNPYNATGGSEMDAPSPVAANVWSHVALASGGGTTTLYLNGVGVVSRPFTLATPGAGSTAMDVGRANNVFAPGQLDEVWCAGAMLSATSVCRICSCGIRGEQCTCSGTSYTATGRNATACGSCPLLADCSAAVPVTITTTTTSTTTTTTVLTALPSWVPSTLAAWMLDEASGTRVNAQGTTTRNLTEAVGTIGNNTVQKQEGTASVELPTNNELVTTEATLVALVANPFTCVIWARPATSSSGFPNIIRAGQPGTNGFQLGYNTTTSAYFAQTYNPATPVNASVTTATTAWTHVAATFTGTTLAIYINGVASGSVAVSGVTTPAGNSFYLGQNNASGYGGELDEAACAPAAWPATSICRVCSCGIRGEQCTCAGTAYVSKGRNASACGNCTLPAACNQATP